MRGRISVPEACEVCVRCLFPPRAFQILCQAVCGTLVAIATSAQAETWHFDPWIGVEETLTNNVNLESNATRRGDLVSQLTPGFRVRETGAHTSLAGFVSVPILLYARTGSENNSVAPQVNLFGTWEMVDRLFFVESLISVNQQYLTPFGPRSESLANATNNRYTSQTYRITPYVKGTDGDYNYYLRDNNSWTKGSASAIENSYTNELVGTFERDPRPSGWAIDVHRTDTKFQDQARQLLELARVRALYQIDPQVQASVSGGYEHNDLVFETKSDMIYGVGARWRPTELANVEANWEHRFFGASYNVAVENRTPLSAWSLVASRNITTYPQQLGVLPGDVSSVLNQLFSSRITDPIARQTLVDQFIRDRGLPSFLAGGVNVYSQQVTLQESLTATAGILGARNTVFFSAYRLRQEPITGSGNALPDPFGNLNNNTQYGGNVIWTHGLTPLVTLTGSLDASRTVLNLQPGVTKQAAVRAGLTSPVAPLTDVYGGVRYQIQRSTVTGDYDELAVFVGVNHRFH